MNKEKKGIGQAITEQEEKLTTMLQARLPMEEYHEVMEQVNILIDLNMHAFMMAVDQHRAEFGLDAVTPINVIEKGEENA